MDKDDVIGIIMFFLVIVAIFIIGSVTIENANTQDNVDIYKAQPKQCEHEWVISSKYDFIFSQYKTISKCSKCGKEI